MSQQTPSSASPSVVPDSENKEKGSESEDPTSTSAAIIPAETGEDKPADDNANNANSGNNGDEGPKASASRTGGGRSASTSSTSGGPGTSTTSSGVSGSQRFPIFRLNQLNETLENVKRKSAGILNKPLLGRRSASLEGEGGAAKVDKMAAVIAGEQGSLAAETESSSVSSTPIQQRVADLPDPLASPGTPPTIGPFPPSIVKPRRASVHFAMDAERPVGAPERVRQDSGGSNSSSRKHRSRKEKLVCRSESPTAAIPMDTSENSNSSLPILGPIFSAVGNTSGTYHSSQIHLPGSGGVNPIPSASHAQRNESSFFQSDIAKASTSANMKPPPISTRVGPKAGTGATRMKPRVKRGSLSSGSGIQRGGNSRKRTSHSFTSPSSTLKEPVKKKKVIEIVSPRKRKEGKDHFEIVKTSSDPIFVRAANKPFKSKNKSNRLKFSRANLHKSNATAFQQIYGSHRVRRPSPTSLQSSRIKQRLGGSPQKKDPEAESPAFPPAFVDDLMWLLQDAENEFGPPGRSSKPATVTQGSISNLQPTENISRVSADLFPQLGTSSMGSANRLPFGRRRVESEPTATDTGGFEMAPGSPTGSQSFYPFRKDLYFSPSPSYAAAGPTGRRRYSRRRHAKIHPPFDDSNCNFQGHYCPNPKVLRSQYCEKHLDKGLNAGYGHCRYVKDGKACGALVQSFDAVMSYCERHANLIARAEYDSRNPKAQPEQARNIVAKISKIFKEGLTKTTNDGVGVDGSVSIPDIFQIIDEPEIVQEFPLKDYTGGLVEELDVEAERNVNPDKPDYDALTNAGYFTTEEIIQIHINKLRKLKALYQREKELEWLTRQQKLRFFREGLEKLKQYGPRFTTNPYLINTKLALPSGYINHQIKQYEAAKAILQTAYKADGQRGLLRLKMLQKTQELARKAKASGQKQHDAADVYDSDTDAESDCGESRDKLDNTRHSGKSVKCAYNEGYAVRACQNPPVNWSNFCLKHILSDKKQVQWIPCKRSIGPDPQDVCKTPCYRILEKYGCPLHSPLVLTKHKPLRRSEEELNALADSDNEEEELTLENESNVLANLVTDECLSVSHLEEALSKLVKRGPMELTDTSDSEETDEEIVTVGSMLSNNIDEEEDSENPISGLV